MDLETARKIVELEHRLDAIQVPETLGNYNIITIPDNVAAALSVVDTGGLEYVRIVSTDARPAIVFNLGGDYGELIERVLSWNEVVDVGTWYDFQLVDTTEGDHFRQNLGVFPAGWTETDAAASTNTNTKYSFWYLRGTNAEISWDYRLQTGITIEGLAANAWASFQFGPILFRDGIFTADVDYYFSIHGETAAAIDLTEYVRVHLWWDSANALWKVRGESDNGAGQTASAWTTLDSGPLHQPLYFRVVIRNDAANTTREYMGVTPETGSHTLLQSVAETTTWGQVYWRINQTRGAGVEDYLYLGAVDYLAGKP